MSSYLSIDEVDTAAGRAIVAERYTAVRRQVPVIYLLAIVNLFGLQLAASGEFSFGLNPPTALALCAAVRMTQWIKAGATEVCHEVMLTRLQQTAWVSGTVSLVISVWCLHLMASNPTALMSVLLFGSLTAIGVAYGLSSFPLAARLPLLVLAVPLAAKALLSDDPQFIGAALSLAVVTALIWRLLEVHNRHFVGLIKSRSVIAHEQERAEDARREAFSAATTDFLTGLPNRRAFVTAIEEKLKTPASAFGVALVDLDRFKPTNDTFGHAAGDELLRTVAARLLETVDSTATVARLGGDEFAVLFSGVRETSAAKALGERILAALNMPVEISGRPFAISACCGVALASHDPPSTASRLLANADVALYDAKASGCGKAAVFLVEMEAPRRRRAQIERALQLTDNHDDVEVVFQPIVDLHTGAIVAQEALARWSDDELGEVSPAEFVPIAEHLNVIGGLSEMLLEKAVAEAVQWQNPVRLSFNLSAVQLCSERSAEMILDTLHDAGLAASRLQVEVTETALLADFDKARENLQRLRSKGVTIVLDDFGAGYASISYLREMQFDQIKLDGSLVTSAQQCPERQRLLGAVIGLCRALNVEPVAEHIETEQQLKLLLTLGCGLGQGYWLHKPMRAPAARELSFTSNDLRELPPPAKRTAAAR